MTEKLKVLKNLTIILLPSRLPELNPVENVWQYLRQNGLSNRVFENYDAILDEVTSALDPKSERDICERIRGLSSDLAVLAVTHRAAFIEIADRVYSLWEGNVSELPKAAAE